MKTGTCFKELITVLVFFWINVVFGNTQNSYKLDIAEDMRSISVEADLELLGNHLLMNWEAAGFLADGWSQFVEDIQAFGPAGELLVMEYIRPGKWKLNSPLERIKLKYRVAIGHDKIPWEEGGHDESAYVLDDLLFMIGRVVFITAGQQPENGDSTLYHVEFENLRADYLITTTWGPISGSDRKWRVQSTNELLSSVILIGKQDQLLIENDNIEVVLAAAPEYKSGLETFASVFKTLVPSAQNRLGVLDESKFVLVANVAPATMDPYFSGGVLNRSISIISPFIPDANVLPMVQHLLFHEYLHLYTLAMNLAPEEVERNYWLMEGVHDYVSSKLLYESGLIDRSAFLNSPTGILSNWNAYTAVENKINIMDAGSEKFENYELIYNGGHTFGVVWDITLLTASKGSYGLLDFWAELLENQSVNTTHLSFNMIYDLAVERGGKEVKELLDNHIIGTEPILLADYLNRIGLEILKDNEASTEQIIINDKAAGEKFNFW